MIFRPPIDSCPACCYPLTGLPGVYRCPECGFEYDEATIVFKPSSPWRTYVSTLGAAAVLAYFLLPIALSIAVDLLGPTPGYVVSLLIFGGPLAVLAWRVRRANKIGRFAAMTKSGLFIRNIGGLHVINWDDISTVAVQDMRPWMKRRSKEAIIGLHGILTTPEEKYAFADAVGRGRSGQPPGICVALDSKNADMPRGNFAVRSRRLTHSGIVILLITFVLLMISTWTTHPRHQLTAGILGVVSWIGIILLLTGLWRSDRRK